MFLSNISNILKKESFYFYFGILLILIFTTQSILTNRYNNYLIFENTVRNFLNQNSLYGLYPNFHSDSNHYGVVFSLFFAPFYLFNSKVGLFLWNLANGWVYFKAVKSLPFKEKHYLFYIISLPSFISCLLSEQFNPMAVAFMIFSYTLLNKQSGFWSAFFIMLGAFIKIYGGLGVLFFFFSKNKLRFSLYLIFWFLFMLFLPMVFSSKSYVIQCYLNWISALEIKNISNLSLITVNVSFLHFCRNIYFFDNKIIPYIISLVLFIQLLPLIKFKQWNNSFYQHKFLASLLLFVVLFSSGAEDCTYIMGSSGIAIWYLYAKEELKISKALYIISFLFAINLPAIFFHKVANMNLWMYSCMSIPFFIIWVLLVWRLITKSFFRSDNLPSS